MASFLPATFQKRLFRYALSQLTFLDMAAFDLDSLEGAWGSRSTGEIRDVPFNVEKLSEILALPSWVKISKAKVLRLRLTVPVAIWREGIEVEIDGVEISCTISTDQQKEKGIQRGAKANQPRSTQLRRHDPGGNDQGPLPSVEAMAQSFVEHEPRAEMEELTSAMAQQQNLEESQTSSSSGEDEGVAPAYTLPGMAADFLWGVGERLRIAIRNISFEVAFRLDIPAPGTLDHASESVTLRLTIASLDVHGVQATDKGQTQSAILLANHRVVVSNVQGFIVSNPSLFSAFSTMSVPASPTTTHASLFRRETSSLSSRSFPDSPSPDRRSASSRAASFSESQDIAMSRPTILDAPPDMFQSLYAGDGPPNASELPPAPEKMSDSMLSSRYHGFGSEAEISQFEDYSSPDQSFLENGRLGDHQQLPGLLADSETLPANIYREDVLARLPETPTQAFPAAASTFSGSASSAHQTSQLFLLGHGAHLQSDPANVAIDLESSETGNSVFHDFSDHSNPESPESPAPRSMVFQSLSNQSSPETHGHESTLIQNSRSLPGYDPHGPRTDVDEFAPPAKQNLDTFPSESAIPTAEGKMLMQSTIFTSDQAQSMYMSAMNDGSSSAQIHVPGGWDADYDTTHQSVPTSDNRPRVSQGTVAHSHNRQESSSIVQADNETSEWIQARERGGSLGEEKCTLPESKPNAREPSKAMRKRFLHVQTVSIDIPAAIFRAEPKEHSTPAPSTASASQSRRMPGEMSLFESAHASRLERSTLRASITAARQDSFSSDKEDDRAAPSIQVTRVELANDMALTKLAIMATQQLVTTYSSPSPIAQEKPTKQTANSWKIRIESVNWAFVDDLNGYPEELAHENAKDDLTTMEVLLITRIEDLSASQKSRGHGAVIDASIGRYTFGYSDEPILSFDSAVKMRESVRDILAPKAKDISITIKTSPDAAPEITVMTLPLHVVLDLRRLDEAFSWFGGLDGMLGLGNSVMSTTTILDLKPAPKATKVRFESPNLRTLPEEKPIADSKSLKVTARIGGVLFDLHGKKSSLSVEGSALKLVHRAEGLGMVIDKLRFTGPNLYHSEADPAVVINFGPLSVQYLQTPKEQDLARLIGLLSPSNQREDDDPDDILIDTLLRQRRKGGLLRLNVEKVKGEIHCLSELDHFSALADEMKKLATVTKYLPEDDRPGAMILSLIEEVDIAVGVNKRFGKASLKCDNIEFALVTMPYLLLLGLDSVSAWHSNAQLLGEVLSQKKRERRGKTSEGNQQRTPMLLVKFIGNDLEPTLKVRVWNLSIAYHVTTVMAAMGIEENASGETVLAEMVNSVANLGPSPTAPGLPTQSSGLSESSGNAKPMKVDIGLRDCVVALNPLRSSSRGLVVLTTAKMSAALPRNEDSEVETFVELERSSFMVVNDTATLVHPVQQPMVPGLTVPPTYGSGHKLALQKMGFVHTADISSARLNVKMSHKDTAGDRTMDVEFSDKLFVIDSCADSTQTMIAIFGGLAPPMPPSTELKYRTEVEDMQDMLASFSGDAYAADEDPSQTYEHIEQSHAEGPFEFDDSPPASLTSSSSDLAAKLGYELPDTGSAANDLTMTQDSKGKAPVRFKLDFAEKFYEPRKETWDGKAYEWNSTGNVYGPADPDKIQRSPLRLRIRDVHIIWNLFDGYDWQHTRDIIGDAVAEVERKAAERQSRRTGRRSLELEEDEESVIDDFLFNSIYIGVGPKNDPRDLARQVNRNLADDASESDSYATPTTVISASPSSRGVKTRRRRLRLDRSKHHKITFELKGISGDVVVYPPGSGETQNSIDIRVKDLEVFDNIHTSTWKKFATYMHDAGPREIDMPMVHIELLNVKPIPDLAASEIVLRLSVLPLRLHVDQDALDFITRFFEFKDPTANSSNKPPTPSEQPFIQRVEINSIPIKLDFKPKRVDYAGLRSGRTTEFMNFVILEGSEMVLQHVIIYGVSGFERMGKTLNDIWTPDVKANQLPGVLAGLAPVRGIVNVGAGIKDLVVIPMREYRKDGRLVRAIQKGAVTFAKTTSTELAKLGARLALGTQTVLQNAEGILSGAPVPEDEIPGNIATTAGADDENAQHISPYADQPLGVMAGVRGAWRHLERDLLLTRDAIIAVPGEIREQGSAQGAARAVLRVAPTLILRPAMGVSKAAGTMLMGATNALDKQERRRTEDKYKRH